MITDKDYIYTQNELVGYWKARYCKTSVYVLSVRARIGNVYSLPRVMYEPLEKKQYKNTVFYDTEDWEQYWIRCTKEEAMEIAEIRNFEENMVTEELLEPIHPGEILIEEFMNPMNLNATHLARDIGVPNNQIYQIILKKHNITNDIAVRLAKYFNTTAEFWLNLQSNYNSRLLQK